MHPAPVTTSLRYLLSISFSFFFFYLSNADHEMSVILGAKRKGSGVPYRPSVWVGTRGSLLDLTPHVGVVAGLIYGWGRIAKVVQLINR